MTTTAALQETVSYLCSDRCLPRNPGTEGGIAARDLLVQQVERIGLRPAGKEGFLQRIPPIGGANVLGSLPGAGDRVVLLGAHYDACLFPNPGADDNAAGVAVLLEVAKRLVSENLGATVLFAFFDAEEPPYFLSPEMGSQWFVDHPTIPLDLIDMMICLDLVGHAFGPPDLPPVLRESVFVLGAEKSTGTADLLDGLELQEGLVPRRIDNYIVPSMSDYDAFMNAGIPFLFYTAGRWEHYHAATDTPDRLDYPKMVGLVDLLCAVIRALADRSEPPHYVADGYDDAATLATIRELLEPLVARFPEAQVATQVVSSLEESLAQDGGLDVEERRAIAFLVTQIEERLA